MGVALLITCFNDTLFPDTGRAVVELLERLGHEVSFPRSRPAAGRCTSTAGYADDGLALARRFVRVFDYEAIVSPSASCVGMVRDREADAGCGQRTRVFELTEFLVDRLGVRTWARRSRTGSRFTRRATRCGC